MKNKRPYHGRKKDSENELGSNSKNRLDKGGNSKIQDFIPPNAVECRCGEKRYVRDVLSL